MQSVNVYNARVTDPKPWARCQGSEVKGEGPTFEEPPEAQRSPVLRSFLWRGLGSWERFPGGEGAGNGPMALGAPGGGGGGLPALSPGTPDHVQPSIQVGWATGGGV